MDIATDSDSDVPGASRSPLDAAGALAEMKALTARLDELLDAHCARRHTRLFPVDDVSPASAVPSPLLSPMLGADADAGAYCEHVTRLLRAGPRTLAPPDPTLLEATTEPEPEQRVSTKDAGLSGLLVRFPMRACDNHQLDDSDGSDDSDAEDDDNDKTPMTEETGANADRFEYRVHQALVDVDHLLPPAAAEALARRVRHELERLLAPAWTPSRLVTAALPVSACGLAWDGRAGWRACEVLVRERASRGRWGLDVVLELQGATELRVQDETPQTTTSLVCPSVVVTARSSLFLPKRGGYDADSPRALDANVLESLTWTLSLAAEKKPAAVVAPVHPLPVGAGGAQNLSVDANDRDEKGESSSTPPPPCDVDDAFCWGSHEPATTISSAAVPPESVQTPRGFHRLRLPGAMGTRIRVTHAACGRFHSLLVSDLGLAFAWGFAMDGALGLGDELFSGPLRERYVPAPLVLGFFAHQGLRVRAVACGGDEFSGLASAAIASDGRVFTWGVGYALGHGSITSASTPTAVEGLADVASVACGSGFMVAIDARGEAHTWGKWADGRLGLGPIPILARTHRRHGRRRQLQSFQLSPRRLPASPSSASGRWRAIACGEAHALGITTDGRLWSWGRGHRGQLGHGGLTAVMAPTLVHFARAADSTTSPSIVEAAAGADWSLALDAQGRVWSWGGLGGPVLGHGERHADRLAATTDVLLGRQRQLAQQHRQHPQQHHAPTLADAGAVDLEVPAFAWRWPRLLPTFATGDVRIRGLSAGPHHAAAVSRDGDLFVWGDPALVPGVAPVPTLGLVAPRAAAAASVAVERVFAGGQQLVVLTSGSFLTRALAGLHEATDNDDTDVVLLVGAQALPAHKFLLARRSPVFRELLLDAVAASAEDGGRVRGWGARTELLVPQLRPDVARAVLAFVYSDRLAPGLPLFLVRDVLRAAEQFALPGLVRRCHERLRSNDDEAETDDVGDQDARPVELTEDEKDEGSLAADLAFAFGDPTWSDLTLVAEGRRVPVHACVLRARSEFFRGLLAFDAATRGPTSPATTTTTTPREVVVEDSYAGLLRVLRFIYNDELVSVAADSAETDNDDDDDDELDRRTDELLEDLMAADRYGLARMKRLLEHHVPLTPRTCLEALVVAEHVHAPRLRLAARGFVESHLATIAPLTPTTTTSKAENGTIAHRTIHPTLARLAEDCPELLRSLYRGLRRHTRRHAALRDWQRRLEAATRRLEVLRERQRQTAAASSAALASTTSFPWVPMILAVVFATLYLTFMNYHESDYPIVPAVNAIVLVGLIAAGLFGRA